MANNQALLEQSRQVNEVWLTSWGCSVEHHGFCTSVTHPAVSDYNALYDLRSADDVEAVLRLASQIAARTNHYPAILVPEAAVFAPAHQALLLRGYQPKLRSETIAVDASTVDGTVAEEVKLRSVTEGTILPWVDLYENNYAFEGIPTGVNRERWLRAFRGEPRVRFFFVDLLARACGTVQLVEANNGCCGVYSLSLPATVRRFRLLRGIVTAVVDMSRRLGCQWISFDRLRSTSERRIDHKLQTFARDGLRWYVLSSDTGYILTTKPVLS